MNGAQFEPVPVFVCERCGKGFLVYPGKRDPDPVFLWWNGDEEIRGEDCLGEIVVQKWRGKSERT